MSSITTPQPPGRNRARRSSRDRGAITIAGTLIAITVALIEAGGSVAAAWISAPRDAAPSPVPSPSVSPTALPAALVVDPEEGAVIYDWPTKSLVRGVLDRPLEHGHTLWFTTKATEEQGFHPARQPCQIVNLSFTCAVLYLGRQDEHGKTFRLELWDADAMATGQLQTYAGRAAEDNTPILQPNGIRVTQDMQLHRG